VAKTIINGMGKSKVTTNGAVTVSLLKEPNAAYLEKLRTVEYVESDERIINRYVNAKIKNMAIKELIKDGVLDADGKLKKGEV